jgi:small-conductance mechanosensitive channel
MHKLKKIIAAALIITSSGFVLAPSVVSAQVDQIQCGANSAAAGNSTTGSCPTPPGHQADINEIVARVINVLSSLTAVVAVIMIMVGGFRYITSAGDSAKATSARGTIFNSVIGLAIAVLAQVIVRFVLHAIK